MKKSILLLAAIFCMTNIFAAITVTAKVKVLVNSQSSIDGDWIMMAESPSWSSGKDNGPDGPKNFIEGNLQIWVPTSFGEMATLGTNDLEGTPITIRTIGDEDYTFSFSGVEGRELKFIDYEADSVFVITNTAEYKVTLAKNSTIAGRFAIDKPFTPDAGDLAVCAHYNSIEIQNNPHTGNIVITDLEGNVVLTKAPRNTPHVISLEGLAPGHYILVIGEKSFEFCNKPGNNN